MTTTTTRPGLPLALLSWYEHSATARQLGTTASGTPAAAAATVVPATRPAATPIRRSASRNPITPAAARPQPSIGRLIRRFRLRRGLNQVTCAALLGRSESWLSQVERGVRPCTNLAVLTELARVLDVNVDILITAATT
ncbi:helix-turn-helix domain-containing protein [Actinoplanes sp. HUAS TT8]|uniref:helix-turn-helix domain-containing protein n=1 Tax=Actinoplanes sp. HUAS TT8 TaxID=3447453 RepID=UPI003F524807